MSNIDSWEPVFRKDVEAEEEYSTQGWRVFFDLYTRLNSQQAPPELLARVAEINNIYKDLTEKIVAIKPCFPVENGR